MRASGEVECTSWGLLPHMPGTMPLRASRGTEAVWLRARCGGDGESGVHNGGTEPTEAKRRRGCGSTRPSGRDAGRGRRPSGRAPRSRPRGCVFSVSSSFAPLLRCELRGLRNLLLASRRDRPRRVAVASDRCLDERRRGNGQAVLAGGCTGSRFRAVCGSRRSRPRRVSCRSTLRHHGPAC